MRSLFFLCFCSLIKMLPRPTFWLFSEYRKRTFKKPYTLYFYQQKDSFSNVERYYNSKKESTDSKRIKHVFAPLNLTIGMKPCKAMQNMHRLPDYVQVHSRNGSRYYTLFYKKKIGTLSCSFELHFHKSKLFLYQIGVYDNQKVTQPVAPKVRLSEFLLNDISPKNSRAEGGSMVFYKDYVQQSICAIEDIFKSRFIVSDTCYDGLIEDFLALRKKRNKSLSTEMYQDIFLKPVLD